jgi:hypothetical protein
MSALLGSHIALRNQRRLQTAMRAARLPAVKTLPTSTSASSRASNATRWRASTR